MKHPTSDKMLKHNDPSVREGKKEKPSDEKKGKERSFFFPTENVTIEAVDQEEAIKKLKALQASKTALA